MKVIVGLGNPGMQYETSRHNVGFLGVDYLVDRWNASGPHQKFKGHLYQATEREEKILLVKPSTYMNLSGECVGPLFGFYRCKPEDLIVIYDDFDVPFGSIKFKIGGGSGGHNGIKSIDQCLNKDHLNYLKVRIGIGHPRHSDRPNQSPVDYVLERFSDQELPHLEKTFEQMNEAMNHLLVGEVEQAMNRFHRKNKE